VTQPAVRSAVVVRAPAAPTARKKRVFWFYAAIVVVHLLAILAFVPGYTLVWWGIPVLLVGNFIFGSLGINLGYHRMLTHTAASFPKLLDLHRQPHHGSPGGAGEEGPGVRPGRDADQGD